MYVIVSNNANWAQKERYKKNPPNLHRTSAYCKTREKGVRRIQDNNICVKVKRHKTTGLTTILAMWRIDYWKMGNTKVVAISKRSEGPAECLANNNTEGTPHPPL